MTAKPIVTAEDIRSLWQSLPDDPIMISIDEMRAKAQKTQSSIRIRNFIEYGAFVLVVIGFGRFALEGPTWQASAANVFMIVCASLSAWNLHRQARATQLPADASASGLIDFQRAELARQRDATRTVWSWYLLPLVPGFAVFSVVAWMGYLQNDMSIERQREIVIGFNVVLVALFAIIVLLNLLSAAYMQRLIDDLDRYKEKT
jgi:hypothetical protein